MVTICNRGKSVRCLCSCLVISTIAGCAAFVYISLLHGVDNKSQSNDLFSINPEKLTDENCFPVCITKECLYQSNYLLKNIEPTADPCENYFEFACGKLITKFSETESRRFITDQVTELHQRLKRILDNIKVDPNSAAGKLKIVYDSCLKESSLDIQAIPTLQNFLHSAGIPNWPHLGRDFQFDEKNLTDVLGKILSHQYYGFINFMTMVPLGEKIEEEKEKKTNITILISNGVYQKKEKYIRKYYLERILNYFELDSASVNEIWEESEALNEAVMLLRQEAENAREENATSLSLTLTCGKGVEIRWEFACKLVDSFIENAGVSGGISNQFAEIESDSIYFTENIFQVLKNFNDRSIANYLAFNLFFVHLEDLNLYFRLISRNDPVFTNPYANIWKDLTHWHHCIDWLTENMLLPLTYEYVKEFSMEEITKVNGLVREIIAETADAVLKQDWMKESVRKGVAEEISNITQVLNIYLEILMEEEALNDLYEEFHPSNTSFMYNAFEHNRFSVHEETLKQHKLAGFLSSYHDTKFLTAAALGGGGTVDFTLGILLPPVYRSGLKRSLNIVSFAVIIAHEVGHNLIDICDHLHEVDPDARSYVDEIRLCLAEHYSQFKYEIIGKNIDGSSHLGENFADTIGMSILDNLIERYSSNDDVFLLPGISYTPKQMFYISALEMWCESDTEEDEIHNYERASHSLGRFRMLGMLQNSKGFSTAFNCRPGSYMNSSTKCTFPK